MRVQNEKPRVGKRRSLGFGCCARTARLWTAAWFAIAAVESFAQGLDVLRETRVGIYVSKKNFRFGPEFHQTFASLLRADDSLSLSETDLHTGVTIWLGNYLTHALVEHAGCREAVFINARPEWARAWVKALENPDFSFASVKNALPFGADYVLLVEGVQWRSETRRTYLTYGNQFYALPRKATMAWVNMRLWSVRTGRQAARCETTVDFDAPAGARRFIPPEADRDRALALWNRLLD
ncbi:MAG: hypothetical protein NZ534_08495, partial [Bacteroidia bacterium]|nr:hypothetical protein [Bacteroidia bacterium]